MVIELLDDQTQMNITSLLECIRRRECCVFIGAGLSKNAGYPLWDDLLKSLKDEAIQANGNPIDDENLDVYDKAELYKSILPRKKYFDVIERIFNPHIQKKMYLPIHLDLVKIPFVSYVTTNYDGIIEKSFEYLGDKTSFCYYPTLSRSTLRSRLIYHVHGFLDYNNLKGTRGSIVLTRSNFARAYKRNSNLMDFMKTIYTELNICFVGFAITDPMMMRTLKMCVRYLDGICKSTIDLGTGQPNRRKHYAFIAYPIDNVKPNLQYQNNRMEYEIDQKRLLLEERELNKMGINSIRYYGDSSAHTHLDEIIYEIREILTDQKDVRCSPDYTFLG